ncbi:MAG: ATP-grasp domain-containing protein, partial [Elusimicrobia bacterium]|nr:ATP-grasp domain-containing protein [Elusimicrobiota bacterium]
SAAPAAADAPDARRQAQDAAAPLADDGVDAGAHLAQVFDASSSRPAALEAPGLPAAISGSSRRHASGLTKAPAAAAVRREFRSPEGAEARELQRLAASLAENGLPSYKTAVVSHAVDERRPTVVILSPGSRHKVAIAREGGKQAPGDVHLALDASWLIQEELPGGKTRLLLKKGVTFDANGQATIVEYKVPKVVRYFANYFTLGANDRDDGVPFERDLDVPQSNSLALEAVVNDKLRMSLVGAANGVEVPDALTLAMPKHPLAGSATAGAVAVADMPRGADKAAEIRRRIDAFADRYKGAEIVIKPSGPQFHSGRGVKFFRKDQRAEMAAHALELANSPMMTQDGAIIVAGRVNSAPLERDGRKMETTLRVLAARTPWGGAVTTDIFARVGPWGKPTTAEAADPRDNATVEPWERLLKDWKLTPKQAKDLDRRVREMGATMLKAIMKMEKGMVRADGSPYQAQTDLIGLDVMIEKRGKKLVPVMIEVNDHDSGGQYNLDNQIAQGRVGTHSRELIATMLQRARRDALRGKTIVLVGAGYTGKRFIFERAKELGVKILLVDKKDVWAREFDNVTVIPVDNSSPEALATARKKLAAAVRKVGPPDGLTTFWEDDVVLASDLAKSLGLPYHTTNAARVARSKFETQEELARQGVAAARREVVKNLTSYPQADHRLALEQFAEAAKRVGFPAVLKPVSGAAAIGTERVNSVAEAVAAYERISRLINPQTDAIFAQNSDLLLMQYLDGHEYDVDLVVRGGKVVFSSLTDNKPTREPSFLATGSRLPSTLSQAQQKEAVDHAVKAALALGLTDGVLHMEGKVTSEGPRLIEANARMGGAYVHDWIEDVWGVDLVEEGLMAAAGVPGKPYVPSSPLIHLDGDFLNSDKAGTIRVLELPEAARAMPGFVRFRLFKKVGDTLSLEDNGGYARVAMLEVGGADAAEAARNREAIMKMVRFEVDPPAPRENPDR